nr:sensor domain-containing protein [Kineococcus aurantiacus]
MGTEQLLTGSRRRAATLRTRRRTAVAALALVVVAVPVGVGVTGGLPGGTPRPTVTVAGPGPAPAGTPVGAAQMLPDATVTAVVPGAVRQEDRVEAAGGDVDAGLCTDVPFTAAPLLGGRTTQWMDPASRQGVTQSVRRFSADGAAAYVQTALDQVTACGTATEETGPWTLVGGGTTGAGVVTAWALVQDGGDGQSLYRVRGVVEDRGVVVDVSADLLRATPDDLSPTVADLVTAGLDAVRG